MRTTRTGRGEIVEVVENRTYRGNQSWNWEQILKLRFGDPDWGTPREYKVRLSVKVDAYDFQSWARADVWSEGTLSWNRVASLPTGMMVSLSPRAGNGRMPEISYVQTVLTERGENLMQDDLDELMRMTEGVLL